jgi:2-polyprenyl-6-methoxyphenol hydroxylase-like FAD-dependent oxidoreductase
MAGTVIVGAGPAGLLLAHLLLQAHPKPHLLPVRIFEARNDPRTPLPL